MLGFRRSSDRFKCVKDSSIQQPQRTGPIPIEGPALSRSANARRIKKIFVSGLPDFLDSDGLFCFFEQNFGPVLDAVVLPFQFADGQRGKFGIVTFKSRTAFLEATRMKSGYIFGRKALIDVIDAHVAKDILLPDDPLSRRPYGEDAPPASLVNSTSLPPWAQRFRDWLPGFLVEVSKRLGEGEGYPLCSLKGDFRATCGLEIDHLALGFEKLRDFIRAWPEICEPKLVPVGTGPATHIVLQRVLPDEAIAITKPESIPATCNVVEEALPTSQLSHLCLRETQPPTGPPNDCSQESLSSRRVTMEDIPQVSASSIVSGRPRSAMESVDKVPLRTAVACKLCNEEARWFAIPCGHLLLCDACKELVNRCGQMWTVKCLLCSEQVQDWVATTDAAAAKETLEEDSAANPCLEKLKSFIRDWQRPQLVPGQETYTVRDPAFVDKANQDAFSPPPPPPPPPLPSYTVHRRPPV